MPDVPPDARWPRLLSLSVHEFRTPLSVVAGYISMLLTNRAGPLSEAQRKLLEEAQKSCARLTEILKELSDLGNLEDGKAPLARQTADLRAILKSASAQASALPHSEVRVTVESGDGAATIQADAPRLTQAFTSIFAALRKEVITTDELLVRERRTDGKSPRYEITVGDRDTIAAIEASSDAPQPFDEYRGGSGMALPVASRIITAHGGQLLAPPGGRKSGARILIPAC
jgi:signal transduction histidine kinase